VRAWANACPVSECQVQRTLVKSPPELWEALSDPASLARHLGEFGEIRITRLEPETTVEWEAEHASGTVHIVASGWGTKVTLTATPAEQPSEPPPVAKAAAMVVWRPPQPWPPPPAQAEGVAEEEPVAHEPAADEPAADEPAPAVAEVPPAAVVRRSWFQRLFGRRAAAEHPVEVPPAPEPIELPVDPEPDPEPELPEEPLPAAEVPLATVEPDVATVELSVASLWGSEGAEPEDAAEPEPDLVPRIDGERATAVLSSVLDDLGAAHHRPFSR
jgi:hypothetical protein